MLEDYEMDYGKPYTWLSWGGLILPEVVRNKDGSLMGFIRYGRERTNGQLQMNFPEGWALWLDVHHLQGKESSTLCILWNPICEGKNLKAINGYLGIVVDKGWWTEHFREVLSEFCSRLCALRPGSYLLRQEEVLSYLKTTLEMEYCQVAMPKVPLYLDAVLSRDMDMKIYAPNGEDKNRLTIRGREIVVATLKDSLRESRLSLILGAFRQMDYRFCRRVIMMQEDKLAEELKRLTKGWCSQRDSITEYMLSKQKGSGGMSSEVLIFAIEPEEREVSQDYIRQVLEAVELPYVLEDYNRKQLWWGSQPGMFRAGGRLWPRKIDSWEDYLLLKGFQGGKEEALV